MVFASVLSCSITFLSGNVRPFFKVYNVGMNCAVPFSCLFRDLPKGKDVVATSCPFAEANSLFMNGVLQSRGYALLYELTAYFACFMWESKVLPLKSLQSSKSPFYASFTIKSVSRKSRFRGKSSEGKILQIPLIQRSCVCFRRSVFLISMMAILVSWIDCSLVFMSMSWVASGIETVFKSFAGLKILRNYSWHLLSGSSTRDKTLPSLFLIDTFPLLYTPLSIFPTIYSVCRSCRFSISSSLSLLAIVSLPCPGSVYFSVAVFHSLASFASSMGK